MPTASPASVAARYLEHLGEADLRRLADLAAPLRAADLHAAPGRIVELLDQPDTYDALLGTGREREHLAVVSPFLVFAAAVHRSAAEIARTGRVPEWVGSRQRLPLFVSPPTRAFLAEPATRLFLAELLASFASVASGSYPTRTSGGWRRRRWSELDPVRLAGLLEAVPDAQRSGVYRRLGDVSLFLTGVFPDATDSRGLGPIDAARLLRAVGLPHGALPDAAPVALLEHLGAQWYRRAVESALARTAQTAVLLPVAEHFADARRLLTLAADRYLFPGAMPWYGDG